MFKKFQYSEAKSQKKKKRPQRERVTGAQSTVDTVGRDDCLGDVEFQKTSDPALGNVCIQEAGGRVRGREKLQTASQRQNHTTGLG